MADLCTCGHLIEAHYASDGVCHYCMCNNPRSAPPDRQHHCHARRCTVPVPPEMLMCRRHWFMVPKKLRDAVWATYRPGQCDDKQPSEAWHKAADAAILAVAQKEASHA